MTLIRPTTQHPQATAPSGGRFRPSLLLAMGFRPFFLLAGLHGAVALALWALWLSAPLAGGDVEAAILAPSPFQWHAHEMLFGFAAAAVAGFLLTAVPNWTASPPIQGGRLALLVAAWLAGRAAVWMSAALPGWLVLVVDVAFFPLLALMLAPGLIRAGKPRNAVFIALLLLFAAASLLSHLGMMGLLDAGPQAGQRLAVDVLVVMMTVIGGRITPAFTGNWLRARGQQPGTTPGWLNAATIGAAVGVLLAGLLGLPDVVRGLLAAVAAVLTLARLATWRGWAVLSEPLLWVLHVGALWLAVGFALTAAALLGGPVPAAAALHAFTAGAAGLLIIAVMSRATLGHTGHPLASGRLLTAAFLFIIAAAALRVFGPLVVPSYLGAMAAAGALWVAGFGLFLVRFVPLLLAPRADGRPG